MLSCHQDLEMSPFVLPFVVYLPKCYYPHVLVQTLGLSSQEDVFGILRKKKLVQITLLHLGSYFDE